VSGSRDREPAADARTPPTQVKVEPPAAQQVEAKPASSTPATVTEAEIVETLRASGPVLSSELADKCARGTPRP
jgi:hypothetical protein